MTQTQRIIKYCAIAFAVFLIFAIISGIASLLGLIGGVFVINNSDEVINELNLNSNANVLDIDLRGTNLIIKTGTELKAETNNEYVTIEKDNNKLIINEKKHNLFNQTNNKDVIVYVPDNYQFDAVSINNGAGNINMENISTLNLYLDLGAGNVTLSNIEATKKAEIDGGAGKLDINNGNLTNLDLDLGVGDVDIYASLLGKIDVDTGVGSTNLNILGSKDDYQIEVDKGIGEITIDGSNVKDEYRYGRGTNKIDIDGGIGNIKVQFQMN